MQLQCCTAMLGCPKTVKDRVPSHVASTELLPAVAMSTARLAWKILMMFILAVNRQRISMTHHEFQTGDGVLLCDSNFRNWLRL